MVFRLADSLPAAVVCQLRAERAAIVEAATRLGLCSAELNSRLHRHFGERVESCLDGGLGSCWLARDEIAALVADALRHFDGVRYRLHAWCIMPNHTHVIVQPDSGHALPAILKSWKGYSAREANRILSRKGEFWQPEYYDHLIRDEGEMAATVRYIQENPVKASLINWRWVWSGAS